MSLHVACSLTVEADAGRDLGSAEQFAFSAMQFLSDSDNAGITPDEIDQIFSGEHAKRFLLYANAQVKGSDITQRFLVGEPGWVRSQWLDEQWTVSDFMFAPGPTPVEMAPYEKKIYMQDESDWRAISAME